MSDFEAGQDAARLLWEEGLDDRPDFVDPLTPEFAQEALTELERLQQSTARVLRQVLEGAQMSAEQLNVESFHGVTEVTQNADDLGASRADIEVSGARGSVLTFSHDGERVQLPHVTAMSLAFLSTKRNDHERRVGSESALRHWPALFKDDGSLSSVSLRHRGQPRSSGKSKS